MSKPISKHFQSETVTIILKDCSAQPFYVHKSLLGSASMELHKHVFNDMQEGVRNIIKLEGVDEVTMKHFLAWLYTESYSPDEGREINSDQKAQANHQVFGTVSPARKPSHSASSPAQKPLHEPPGPTDDLLVHAKIHVFTDRFNISALKSLTLSNIVSTLSRCGNNPQAKMRRDIALTILYCLENLPLTRVETNVSKTRRDSNRLPEDLLLCFADYVNWALNSFRTDETVLNTLLEEMDFAKLLIYRSQPTAKPPWISGGFSSGW